MKFSQHYLMELRLRTPHFNPRLAVTQHCDVGIMLRYWCSFVLVLISNEGIMKPPALDVCLCRPLNKTHLHVDVRQFSHQHLWGKMISNYSVDLALPMRLFLETRWAVKRFCEVFFNTSSKYVQCAPLVAIQQLVTCTCLSPYGSSPVTLNWIIRRKRMDV